MEDMTEDLPDTLDAWSMYKDFHDMTSSITFSNALEP